MFHSPLLHRVAAAGTAACLLAVLIAPRADAAVADPPDVGPEHAVSSPIEGPVAGAPFDADAASDGTNQLVVWTDSRSYESSGYDVYGARVTPQGAVLDPSGIRIATGLGDQTQPSVAFGDGTYLVVWSDGPSEDIHGARVT